MRVVHMCNICLFTLELGTAALPGTIIVDGVAASIYAGPSGGEAAAHRLATKYHLAERMAPRLADGVSWRHDHRRLSHLLLRFMARALAEVRCHGVAYVSAAVRSGEGVRMRKRVSTSQRASGGRPNSRRCQLEP
jgi:hypothetical protein